MATTTSNGTVIVDIDASKAVTEILKYVDAIDELKAKKAELSAQIKDDTATFGANSNQVLKGRQEMEKYTANIRDLQGKLQSLRKTTAAQSAADRDHTNYVELGNQVMNRQIQSIAQATEANRLLREAVRNITDTEDYDLTIRNRLNAAIEENTAYIRRNSDAYIQQKMNIGNYTESVKKAFYELKAGGSVVKGFGIIANASQEALRKQAEAVLSALYEGGIKAVFQLNLVKIALSSLGLLSVLTVATGLYQMFTKNQAAMDKLSVVAAGLGQVLKVVAERCMNLVGALGTLLSGDFSNGLQELKNAFAGVGDEIVREANQAALLQYQMNLIKRAEAELAGQTGKMRMEAAKYKLVADDTTKSLQERTEAAKQAYNIENDLAQKQIAISKQRLANQLGIAEWTDEAAKTVREWSDGLIDAEAMMGRLGLDPSNLEDLKAFNDELQKMYQYQQTAFDRNKELQNKINQMQKEAADKAKAAKEKELAEVRKAEDMMIKSITDSRARQAEEVNTNYDRQIADLRKRMSTETDLTEKAKQAIYEQITYLEQERNKELAKLSKEALDKEVADKQKAIALMLEAVKKGTAEEYDLKRKQMALQMESELSAEGVTAEQKALIRAKYAKQQADLTAEQVKAEADAAAKELATRYENEYLQAKLSGASEVDLLRMKAQEKMAILSNMRQMDGESEEEYLSRKLRANDDYLAAEKALSDKEVAIQQEKAAAIASLTGSLSDLMEMFGEESKEAAMAAKVLALAEISINTGKAIAAGIAQAQSVPFPANLAAIATTVAAVMSGITSAIKTVKSAKFAEGGLITGEGTGTSDDVTIQASNGESVMTARATSMFTPLLSTMNQIGGGVPIQATQSANSAAGEDMLARAFAKGLQSMPNPVVSVQEITDASNRVRVIESLSKV